MEKFTKISALSAPLPQKDVDTDLIIPAQYLTSTSRSGYGENLFRRIREEQRDFFLNLPKYQGAKILIVGENFGCGSSREHAVWALLGAGFTAIVGTSFADIFSGNSAKNGLLLISLTKDEANQLMLRAEQEELVLSIDLYQQSVITNDGLQYKFNYDPFRKSCLLNGQDDLDYLLAHKEQITKFFMAKGLQAKPTLFPKS